MVSLLSYPLEFVIVLFVTVFIVVVLPNYLHDIVGEIALVLHAVTGLARIILVARSMINENIRSPVHG